MDATAGKNHDKGSKKMSRGGLGGLKQQQQQEQSHSFWGAMALKNRSQPGGAGESKNCSRSSKKTKTKTRSSSISISRSMACAGSICSTKESSVLSRGSRRSSEGGRGRNTSSSRSLKGPDDGVVLVSVPASGAAVSASSSFNSETTVATTSTTSSSSTLSSSAVSSPLSSIGAGSTSRSFRKLSGCHYECHSSAALDPRTSLGGAAAAKLSCPDCDEVFLKAESLELHQATRHAVSELGADDTSRNVVEIIFQSSWLVRKLPAPVACRVERILKVRSSGKTVERFEQYRESVKARAASSGGDELARRSYPRCAADGNELLRFHCTTFQCSLGLAGATLCRTPSAQQCKLCSIIRDGFSVDGDGKIATMATSGRAHDMAARVSSDGGEKRAMLVCRVVAGRVKKVVNGNISSEEFGFDSVSSCSKGVYSDLDELFVFNPRAILPCFVVIYSGY